MTRYFDHQFKRGLMAAALFATALPAAQAATIGGSVAGWVATAPRTGAAADSQSVTIVVHLALRDQDALTRLVADVSKPGSPLYGHYLTPAALADRFAPAKADVDSVRALLTAAHMADIEVGPMGAYVSATATVAQLRTAFAVSQDLYQVNGRSLRANRQAPTIPDALAGKILYIEGLDDTNLKHPLHVTLDGGVRVAPASFVAGDTAAVTPPPVAANAPSPYCSQVFENTHAVLSTRAKPYYATLPWLGCGYTPQQIRSAYGLDKVTPTGKGVTVAIVDAYASPTLLDDSNQYSANHGLPKLTDANFKAIFPPVVLTASPTASCLPYSWWGEESLDVAAVHGAAPGAGIVYVGSKDCGGSLTSALFQTIYNHRADVVTNSYGFNSESRESAGTAAYDQAFKAAAATGITVLFSSGDEGDLSQVNGFSSGSGPGDSAYTTDVGGTSLLLRGGDGPKEEYGWGNYRDYLNNALVNNVNSVSTTGPATTVVNNITYDAYAFYSGAGGGISLFTAQPAYQAGIVPAALASTIHGADGSYAHTPSPKRVLPDVAMVADPYTGYLVGQTMTISGSSITDAGCTPTSATTEYCEEDFGGTSLASPLMAGVIAVFNQARLAKGEPLVGFFNPLLYSLKPGATLKSAAINDVLPPATPVALLRGYQSDLTRVRVVTINSVPALAVTAPYPLQICAKSICQGLNDVFNYTTPGFDDVTGLGVPYLPFLVQQ